MKGKRKMKFNPLKLIRNVLILAIIILAIKYFVDYNLKMKDFQETVSNHIEQCKEQGLSVEEARQNFEY